MYCGDETGSFIGEIGSHTCKFGYGGEDNPKLVLPSYVSKLGQTSSRMATSAVSSRLAQQQQEMESILRRPDFSNSIPLTDPNAFLRQGDLVEHWDHVQTAWETGMELLRAKDTLKHTLGGAPYSKSGSGSSSNNNNNNISSGSGEGKCVHPILAITPGFTQFDGYGPSYCAAVKRKEYIQYTEFLMEQVESSSLFLAPAPMLAAFSMGRQTALVVDIGAGGTRVTPVIDGLVLGQAQRRNGRGGDWLGHVTWKALLEHKMTPKPRYLLRQDHQGDIVFKAKSSLFHTWAMQELMYELRTEPFVTIEATPPINANNDNDENSNKNRRRVPFTKTNRNKEDDENDDDDDDDKKDAKDEEMEDASNGRESPPSSPGSTASMGSASHHKHSKEQPTMYTLPDGSMIDLTHSQLGKDLKCIPELLFAKTLPFHSPQETGSNEGRSRSRSTSMTSHLETLTDAPLPELVQQSLLAVGDVDARKDLASNIVLVGGSSLFPNLDARLSHELSHLLPAFTKPKVIASRFSVERSFAPWIGASILTSLGSFQQLWLSRTEYEEYGSTMAIQRFP